MRSVRRFDSVPIGLLAVILSLTSNVRLAAQTNLALKDGAVAVDGELVKQDANDPVRKHPCKTYVIKLKGGQAYQIDMVRKKEVDPYLRLEDTAGKELASDDDSGGFPNARIIFNCPKDGLYHIVATTFDGSLGSYALTVKDVVAVKAVVLMLKDGRASLDGTLTKEDPKDIARPDAVCKVYAVTLAAGKAYQINMVSKKLDSYLRLEDAKGKVVAKDDDSGGDRNARIVFNAPQNGTYRIIATTFKFGLGNFQLTVSPAPATANLDVKSAQWATAKGTVDVRAALKAMLLAGQRVKVDQDGLGISIPAGEVEKNLILKLQSPKAQAPGQAGTVRVLSAHWGVGDRKVDVAGRAAELIKAGKTVKAEQTTLQAKDPAAGVTKWLTLDLEIDGIPVTFLLQDFVGIRFE